MLALLMLCSAINWANAELLTADKTVLVGGSSFVFKAGTELETYDGVRISRGVLAQNASVKIGSVTIPVKIGEVCFFENGIFAYGTLSSDTTVGMIRLKGGKEIQFFENGLLDFGFLSAEQEYRGLKLRADSEINLFENGALEYCSPVENITVNGFTLDAEQGIGYFENGNVEYGYLAQDTELKIEDSVAVFKSGFAVRFYSTGSFLSGFLSKDFIFYDFVFQSDTYLEIYDYGLPKEGTFGERTEKTESYDTGRRIDTSR